MARLTKLAIKNVKAHTSQRPPKRLRMRFNLLTDCQENIKSSLGTGLPNCQTPIWQCPIKKEKKIPHKRVAAISITGRYADLRVLMIVLYGAAIYC